MSRSVTIAVFRLSFAAALGFAVPAATCLAAQGRVSGAIGQPFPQANPKGANHLYSDLQEGLLRYRQRWGSLPNVQIPVGPVLRQGQQGPRVALLRHRLGLSPGTFDGQLAAAVRDYKGAHGLGADAQADGRTVASLNRGSAYYERVILLNLERVRALPADRPKRYILVDAAAARLWLYVDDEPRDSMKVIVGKVGSETPVLTTMIRSAEINPYWNVPPDMAQRLIAPRVLREGVGYLRRARYEVLSDFSSTAHTIDPAKVDWKAAAAGRQMLRVRQLPGVSNSMGEIKFVSPNDHGIYLHDTPNKTLFAREDRWLSNGCVRVEDARRLAKWLLGEMPAAPSRDKDFLVPLAKPVPVYITYLTAAPGSPGGNVIFRPDPYRRDAPALAGRLGTSQAFPAASLMRTR